MYLSNYNANLREDQADQMNDTEINTFYARKRNYTECVTMGFCPTCNKRLTNLDDVCESENGVYCSEKCEIKMLEDEAS